MVAPPQAWWPLRGAARADCDDDCASPANDGHRRELVTILPSHDALVTKRAARTSDDDDDVCPASGSDRRSMASPATPRTPAALIADDDDDVSPESHDGGQLITPRTLTQRAGYAFDDDDDVCPASGGDRQSMASPVRLRQPALPVADDDDDVCPSRCAEEEAVDAFAEALVQAQLVRNSAAPGTVTVAQRAEAEARVVRERAKDEARLHKTQARLDEAQERLQKAEVELAMCEADERAMNAALSESTGPSRQGSTLPTGAYYPRSGEPCEALLRARRHLSAEKARRQTASAEAMGRLQAATVHLDTATAQLSEADTELIAAARVEQELADASASVWAQVHLARVRAGKERQRAEAEARAMAQRAKEEVRQQQAKERLDEAQERLRQSELELAVCEVDEKALDALLSELSEPEPTETEPISTYAQASGGGEVMAPPVSQGPSSVRTPYGSSSAAADVDDEMSLDADDVGVELSSVGRNVTKAERVANARQQLAAEQARREAALAQTERQRETALEAARARLQAASAQLAQIASEAIVAAQEEKEAAEAAARAWSQVHTVHERTGTATQRAAVEASAARQRAEEEARLLQAKAKLAEVQRRLRQTERELALCNAEERALNEPMMANKTLPENTRSSRQRSHPVTRNLLSVTEEIVVEIESVGRISTSSPGETPKQHAAELERGKIISRPEAKQAKRVERLQRARRQLEAERARGRKAGLAEGRARHEDAPAASMARVETATAQLAEAEVEATAAAQAVTGAVLEVSESARVTSGTASLSPPLAGAWDGRGSRMRVSEIQQSRVAVAAQSHPPNGARRTSLSLVSRRRVVVDPSSASCTQQPSDRRGSPRGKSPAQFQAQQWLSTALTQAEDPKDDTATQ